MHMFKVAEQVLFPISLAYCEMSHSLFCSVARLCSSLAASKDTPSNGMHRILVNVLRSVNSFRLTQICGISWSSTRSAYSSDVDQSIQQRDQLVQSL
jgi:hypothetical protein